MGDDVNEHDEQASTEQAPPAPAPAHATSLLEQAARMAIGRPRLGEERRPSAVWKVRASAQLDDAALQYAREHGLTMSDLVRQAVHEYVQAHP